MLVNTISPNSYGLSEKDAEVRRALQGSDALILDGLYFGLAPLLLKGQMIKRITGWDSFIYFSRKMNEIGGKVFFLGSSVGTLTKIKGRYQVEYPNCRVETYSPPLKRILLRMMIEK